MATSSRGSRPRSDEAFRRALDQINTLEQPVVYSIGDNEWTDCYRHSSSRADPRERLARLRQLAFPKPGESLGRTAMPEESQSKLMPKYAKFVENQRFARNGVVFIVPHVVGSNNGFDPGDPRPSPSSASATPPMSPGSTTASGWR